jgi:dUTP pyrophosphatase
MIKFEKAKGFENQDIKLPVRSSKDSNGYDFYANETVVVPSYPKYTIIAHGSVKPVMVSTGVTAQFPDDVALLILDRSSNPIKRGLSLANSVGDIDSGYFPMEIKGMFYNFSDQYYVINKGDRIMQGIFVPFLLTSDDQAKGKRDGGFGSTGR